MPAVGRWTTARRTSAALLAGSIGFVICLANSSAARLLPQKTLCWSVRLLDRECPGCGLTRSMLALGRGEFSAALDLNWLGVAISIALVAFLLNRLQPLENTRRRLDITIGAMLVGSMIARTLTFYAL